MEVCSQSLRPDDESSDQPARIRRGLLGAMKPLGQLRIALPLGIALFAIAVTVLSYWNSRRELVSEMTRQAATDVDAFVTRFRTVLQSSPWGSSQEWKSARVASLAASPTVALAVLLSPEGRIVASTRPQLIGQQLEARLFGIGLAPMLAVRARGANAEILTDAGARRITGYIRVCDGPASSAFSAQNCGVFVYQESLARAYGAALSALNRQVTRESLGVGILAALMWLGIHYRVTRRVNRLITTANAFAAGDRRLRSRISGVDEISSVANAFDAALDVIVRDEAVLRSQTASLHTLALELEDRVKQRTAEVERAAAYKSRLLAMASHDLRQPLQTVKLLNATLRRLVAPEEAQELLARQNLALTAMGDLTDTLLNVAKLESGTLQPQICEFALPPLLQELGAEFLEIASAKGLALRMRAIDVHLSTDRTLLRQMIQNLLTNAIRYTDRGEVCVLCRAEGEHVTIEVQDTGIGIPAGQLESIFEEFHQVRAANLDSIGRGGLGLGLSIVRRLAALLQLRVEVRSTLESGSTFTVSGGIVKRTSATQIDRARASLQSPRKQHKDVILLIEDDEPVRMATAMFLRTESFDVQQASGFRELREKLAGPMPVPALVISDFHLGPDEFGPDAIALVRERFGAALPAIVVTGDTSSLTAFLRSDGHNCVLNKPVDVEKLVETIRALISRSHLAAAS